MNTMSKIVAALLKEHDEPYCGLSDQHLCRTDARIVLCMAADAIEASPSEEFYGAGEAARYLREIAGEEISVEIDDRPEKSSKARTTRSVEVSK